MAVDNIIFLNYLELRKPRETFERMNPFESMDDENFRRRFRMRKSTVNLLLLEVIMI